MLKSCVVATLALCATACGGAPRTTSGRISLEQSARATLSEMEARDPSLPGLLQDAYAYAVFPSIGKGGAIVGGAFGRGILYERDRPSGYVELAQASLGAQLGGETFAELVVLRDPEDVRDIKAGAFKLGGNASVTVLTTGAGRAATLGAERKAVFVLPRGGLMVDISVTGQRLDYRPFLDRTAG
jgi:lipid-binding SYLF domain-containing protein